jgi:hypothetical protein
MRVNVVQKGAAYSAEGEDVLDWTWERIEKRSSAGRRRSCRDMVV